MKTNKSVTAKAIIFLITVISVISLGMAVAVQNSPNGEATAATSTYALVFSQSKNYVTAEKGYTLKVYLPKELWDSYDLKITYQRLELNATETDNVNQSGGETTDINSSGEPIYKVLDEKGTVAVENKSDSRLKDSEKDADILPKYFELTTDKNCAYIFTVTRLSASNEEEKTEYQTAYVRKIDSAAPTYVKTSTVWRATGMKVNFSVYDNKNSKSATSGINEIYIYKENEEEPVFEKSYGSGYGYARELSCFTEFGKKYYIVMSDYAGNKTERLLFANYESNTYDAVTEAEAENAINAFGSDDYADNIVNAVNTAFGTYMAVTRDEQKSEEEKQKALTDLKSALKLYEDAKDMYESGYKIKVNSEVVNGESAPLLTIVGAESGLTFLKIGDEVNITLSAAHYMKPDSLANKKFIEVATDKFTEADELYVVEIKTVSVNEYEIRRSFESDPEIRFEIGEAENVAAVQTVYSVTGKEENYKCVTVMHTDGKVSVSVPYTGGTVKIYVVRDGGNNLYWLFALTAIPLVLGAAMLIYAFRKMKKIKEEALKKQEEEKKAAETEKATENEKKKPPKNKKKKK